MAYEESLVEITLPAAADFSATGQYRFGRLNTSSQIALASAAGIADGVITDNPDAAGKECSVAISGVVQVELGGTVTAADQVQVGTNGVAVSGSTNSPGIALESGVSGDIISVLLKL